MIPLTLLSLSFGFTFAIPTPSDLPTDISPSVFTRSADKFGTRSTWAIIWSCLSTIFACTWIAVHPNIPGPKVSRWAMLRTRVRIMAYILIAPEMVIVWAAKQHIAARNLAKQYQACGWTMAHGFFISMGGFTLYDERGSPLRILVPNELKKLSKAGKIAWPPITEEEIQDRSKGDYLSKAFVLMQTSWFIVQYAVRCVYGLAVTELEVATLAFALVTGVAYYLWWDKPLDVRCSVPVYLQDSNQVHVDSQSPRKEEIQVRHQTLDVTPTTPKSNSRELNFTATAGSNSTRMQRFRAFFRQKCQKYGICCGLIYVLLYPLAMFFNSLWLFFSDLWLVRDFDTLHNSSPLRVPTFYSPTAGMYHFLFAIGTSVAVIFGIIHCLAWSFHFPCLQVRLAWRISAASVSGLPVVIAAFIYYFNFGPGYPEKSSMLEKILEAVLALLGVAFIVIYVIARIVLLVLPCVALRALPAAAHVEFQWASFFPHIG